MKLALLLALQASPQAPAERLAIDFDLAKVKPSDPCVSGSGGSVITVCGRRPRGVFDREKWEREFRTEPLTAETSIGPGATVGAYLDSATMPGGQISKRALVRIKIGF